MNEKLLKSDFFDLEITQPKNDLYFIIIPTNKDLPKDCNFGFRKWWIKQNKNLFTIALSRIHDYDIQSKTTAERFIWHPSDDYNLK